MRRDIPSGTQNLNRYQPTLKFPEHVNWEQAAAPNEFEEYYARKNLFVTTQRYQTKLGPDHRWYTLVYTYANLPHNHTLQTEPAKWHLSLLDTASLTRVGGAKVFYYLGQGLLTDAVIQDRLHFFQHQWQDLGLAPCFSSGTFVSHSFSRFVWITGADFMNLARSGRATEEWLSQIRLYGLDEVPSTMTTLRHLFDHGDATLFPWLGRAYTWAPLLKTDVPISDLRENLYQAKNADGTRKLVRDTS